MSSIVQNTRTVGDIFNYQYEILKQTASSKYLHYIVQKFPVTETGFKGKMTRMLAFPTSQKREHYNDLILFKCIGLGFFANLKISMLLLLNSEFQALSYFFPL